MNGTPGDEGNDLLVSGVITGRQPPGNRNDCKAWEESGAKATVGTTIPSIE